MEPHFSRAAIIGVGLLGASLGLALKARGIADKVIGIGRRQSSLDVALESGAIDEAFLDAAEGAAGADLIVVATPAALVQDMLDAVQPACGPNAVVTDVASTKGAICAHAAATWPSPRRFVGSHPMAGSEKYGPEHGRPDLYDHSVCLVETGADLDPDAHAAIAALWRAVGARVVEIEPEAHDAILARTSHLPHVAAVALAIEAATLGSVADFVGNGFRDTTRIAASRAEVWRDICSTNRHALSDAIASLTARLEAFRQVLEQGDDAALETFFNEGADARRKALHK